MNSTRTILNSNEIFSGLHIHNVFARGVKESGIALTAKKDDAFRQHGNDVLLPFHHHSKAELNFTGADPLRH